MCGGDGMVWYVLMRLVCPYVLSRVWPYLLQAHAWVRLVCPHACERPVWLHVLHVLHVHVQVVVLVSARAWASALPQRLLSRNYLVRGGAAGGWLALAWWREHRASRHPITTLPPP